LRGRFHHDFVDLALDEPVSKRAQLDGTGPDLQPFKVEVTFDCDVSPPQRPTSSCARQSPAMWYGIGFSSWERRACLVASIRVASYCRAEHGYAQLFGQSRTPRVKQLLGLERSMANPDLAAPNAAILPNQRFSCPFAGLQAQLQPVAEIVPDSPPIRN